MPGELQECNVLLADVIQNANGAMLFVGKADDFPPRPAEFPLQRLHPRGGRAKPLLKKPLENVHNLRCWSAQRLTTKDNIELSIPRRRNHRSNDLISLFSIPMLKQSMTDRLYYHDSFLYNFDAVVRSVVETPRPALILDRTAFYPTSGGQIHDTGWLISGEEKHHVTEVVLENRAVDIRFVKRDEAEKLGLRKLPDAERDQLRLIDIRDFDLTACGGTHVPNTGQIGSILLRKSEKVRQGYRVEFVAGGRAISTARRDFSALTEAAVLFSAPIYHVPQQASKSLE